MPTPTPFDETDPSHLAFVLCAARLKAATLQLAKPRMVDMSALLAKLQSKGNTAEVR